MRNVNGKKAGISFFWFLYMQKGGSSKRLGGGGGGGGLEKRNERQEETGERKREGKGEGLSAIVRIHRVIHYIANCVTVSGHFHTGPLRQVGWRGGQGGGRGMWGAPLPPLPRCDSRFSGATWTRARPGRDPFRFAFSPPLAGFSCSVWC